MSSEPSPTMYADLFEQRPLRWGLRGDPHLWQELQAHFASSPLPEKASELQQQLGAAFHLLTGASLSTQGSVRVERFPTLGMSGGLVSVDFWRESAVPFLLSRFQNRA